MCTRLPGGAPPGVAAFSLLGGASVRVRTRRVLGSVRPACQGNAPEGGHMTTTSARTGKTPYTELAAGLRGDLIMPGDPGYDEARAVYNAMIDKRPAAIARCRDVADVVACVRFGRQHGV